MFQKLYAYIQGENSEGVVMKMTAPVFSFIHLNTENKPDKIAMCFWMHQMNKVCREGTFSQPNSTPTRVGSFRIIFRNPSYPPLGTV